MEKCYQEAHILFMPSLLESFGLPFIEALAFGIPIAASDREFAQELCGDAALYFDPHSAESVSTALTALINDKDKYEQLSNKAVKRFQKIGLTWIDVAKKMLEISQRVVCEHKK
ncbi:glycosyltransferase [Peptococcaceae bacterium]|nr:glycosyltransferase [Peptococcaceae bacterium]MCL0106609.1 glycosyltransferase [Peptococcaceae bacterium]